MTELRRLTSEEFWRVRVGLIYALFQIAGEVLGANDALRVAIESMTNRHETRRISGRARWLQDRFARACQDFGVWHEDDRRALRDSIFFEWLDWRTKEIEQIKEPTT